jgi:hypothetical protein
VNQLKIPEPDLQITFCDRLAQVRGLYLLDALLATVAVVDLGRINGELEELAPAPALQRVAGWGLRGEIVFAVPAVLAANPKLLGYYRLLLGFSQKQFYGKRYDFAPFKPMETRAAISAANAKRLRVLCVALISSGAALVEGVSRLSCELIHDLTWLTLGPQLRGGVLNTLGTVATRRVFDLIQSLLALGSEISHGPRHSPCQQRQSGIAGAEGDQDGSGRSGGEQGCRGLVMVRHHGRRYTAAGQAAGQVLAADGAVGCTAGVVDRQQPEPVPGPYDAGEGFGQALHHVAQRSVAVRPPDRRNP